LTGKTEHKTHKSQKYSVVWHGKRKKEHACAKTNWHRQVGTKENPTDQRLTTRSELNSARREATNCVKPEERNRSSAT